MSAQTARVTSAQLLFQFDSLSHIERQQQLALLGRDPRNAALFDELERGATSYERRLAVQSCSTSRDGERLLRMMSDSSRLVRGAALRLLPVAGDDAQIGRAFAELKAGVARALLIRLKKRGRQSAIDAIIQARFASNSNDGALESLVPFASPAVAEPLLQGRFERASASDFGRLARLQPLLALEHALELARGASSPDGVVLAKCNAVLSSAAWFTQADERATALQLARELNRQFPLARLELDALLASGSAQALAELVLASGETVSLAWGSRARRIEAPTLLALISAQHGAIGDWARVLKRLPFQTRAQLFREFGLSWRDAKGAVSPALLALLPREERQSEARRHLEIPDLKAAPASWLLYLSLLPAEEAMERARPFLGDPDPNFRAAALAALVGQTRFERASIGAVLEALQKRGNEQDPVRLAMLGALAALPPSVFGEEELPALAKIQRQALDARDLSYATAASLERIVVAQLPHFPAWAATQIAQLLKERGHVSFFDLQNRVTDDQMREIGPTLEPVFAAWAAREHAPFLSAMRAFGKRLKVWDAGARLLERFLQSGPTTQLPVAAQILASFRRDLWRHIAPRLLAQDESWALQPVVFNFLHTQRTDLLSPAMLGRRRLAGRFSSGRARQVLPFAGGFERWTPTQQALFAQTLDEVLRDTSRESPGAFFAINRLCEMPDIAPDVLLEQAQLSNSQAAWREAALRVLSRLDGGQGVGTLLESLDDERARIAIYGLRRALLEMPAPRALEILREVPLQKVTVVKEVVRLLGELQTPDAFEFLVELSSRELHRDARVALLRALWDHLENPRVWPLLEGAASSEDPAIATMAARTTAPRMSLAARRKLNALLSTLLAHPDARVRLQVLGNGALGAISDPDNQLLEPLLRCLDSPVSAEYLTAAKALLATYGASHPDVLAQGVGRLLPRRRALGEVLSGLEQQIASAPAHFAAPVKAVLDVLASDQAALSLRLKLAFLSLETDEFAAMVEAKEREGALHAGVLSLLVSELERATRSAARPAALSSSDVAALIGSSAGLSNADILSGLVRAQAAARFGAMPLAPLFERWTAGSPNLRRLALAILVRQSRNASGWTLELREALVALRADPSALVSSAAQFTFWPGEEG